MEHVNFWWQSPCISHPADPCLCLICIPWVFSRLLQPAHVLSWAKDKSWQQEQCSSKQGAWSTYLCYAALPLRQLHPGHTQRCLAWYSQWWCFYILCQLTWLWDELLLPVSWFTCCRCKYFPLPIDYRFQEKEGRVKEESSYDSVGYSFRSSAGRFEFLHN